MKPESRPLEKSTGTANEVYVKISGVSKTYRTGRVDALLDISLEITRGSFVALVGPSGCGKSTLLNLIGAVDTPSEGDIWLAGEQITSMSDRQLTDIRRTRVGFIFQFFNLLSTLTVFENVAVPLELSGVPAKQVEELVSTLLERVGIKHRAKFYPQELSGGEMQRTAIARALIHKPEIIVADEPTGNLDSDNGASILTLLRSLAGENGQTVVMATHSREAAEISDRIVEMKDGRIVNSRKS